jgi:A/G-specific adenine glycosylase
VRSPKSESEKNVALRAPTQTSDFGPQTSDFFPSCPSWPSWFNPLSAAEKRRVRAALLRWYRANRRDLPWRRTRDPYRIWLSEILLQQTRVETGLPYYERFVAAFPTVADLAAAPLDRVLKLWDGLGYYTRARNLHRAARLVVHERGGVLPRTAEQWQQLPGIGRYTAGAIASIAFDAAVPVVDGNVKRVFARVFCIERCIDAPAIQTELWRIAADLLPPTAPGDFNQSLMELGARLCTPRKPRCADCPIRRCCAAHAAGAQDRLPRRRPKKRTGSRAAVRKKPCRASVRSPASSARDRAICSSAAPPAGCWRDYGPGPRPSYRTARNRVLCWPPTLRGYMTPQSSPTRASAQ